MTNEKIVQGLLSHDWEVAEAISGDPPALFKEIEAAFPRLDAESALLAATVIAHQDAPAAGALLLKMTSAPHSQAAMEAAMAIAKLRVLPPAADLADATKRASNALVRGQLYLDLGLSKDRDALNLLQNVARQEPPGREAHKAEVAAIRLGSVPERQQFLIRIRTASVPDVTEIHDQLVYVGDLRFAKGLLPWLDQRDPVTRLGRDAALRFALMCDVAVWTAHQLDVKITPPPQALDNYPAAMIENARKALMNLPDP